MQNNFITLLILFIFCFYGVSSTIAFDCCCAGKRKDNSLKSETINSFKDIVTNGTLDALRAQIKKDPSLLLQTIFANQTAHDKVKEDIEILEEDLENFKSDTDYCKKKRPLLYILKKKAELLEKAEEEHFTKRIDEQMKKLDGQMQTNENENYEIR